MPGLQIVCMHSYVKVYQTIIKVALESPATLAVAARAVPAAEVWYQVRVVETAQSEYLELAVEACQARAVMAWAVEECPAPVDKASVGPENLELGLGIGAVG